jgi:peptidoglycan/xylan/chitin deacetylase (PgdA/CDA1 family)
MTQPLLDYKKLLRGQYEAERLPKNSATMSGTPDFAYNVLNPMGLLYRPVMNEDFLENGGQRPCWPDEKPFAVCLTHDVDAVSSYSLRQSSRERRARLYRSHSLFPKTRIFLGFKIDIMRGLKRSWEKDPLHRYERWLEAEKEVGAHSTFFFWPGWSSVTKRHYSDCVYELFDKVVFDGQKCTVAEMIREIDRRGWEIGLHPSWYSYDDLDEQIRQKDALQKALGRETVSVRQHLLHHNIRITPGIQAEAGFKYDSTLGFNDNVGFRFGTCYPWYLYDIREEKELPIIEIPPIVQDGALLSLKKGLRLDAEMSFQYVIQMTEVVQKVGGVLTLVWHANMINHTDWWDLYARTLQYLKKKDPWFATVREIGEWWQMNA